MSRHCEGQLQSWLGASPKADVALCADEVLGHFGHGHAVGQSKDLWIDIEVPLSPAVRFASPGLTIDSNIVRWHLSQMNVVATVRPSTVIQSRITVEVVTMSKKSPSDLPLSAFQFQYARSSTPTPDIR